MRAQGCVWQMMRCLCGRLCHCMHAFVAASAVRAWLHSRFRTRVRTCVAEATSIVEYGGLCNRMCGGVCCCMRAGVAANVVCACLCGTFCAYVHGCVARTPCPAANVTAGNCVQPRGADFATACVRVCVANDAVLVWPIVPLQPCLYDRLCSLCMPAQQIMHVHACMCGRLCNSMRA